MKITNKVFLILLVSLAASPLFAQIDTFVQKVNGTGSLTAAVQAADGGFVTTSKIGFSSILVRKINVSGQKQWERRLDFQSVFPSVASIDGIAQTTDGGFVLAGLAGCGCDIECFFDIRDTLVKLRAKGTVAWKKSSGFGSYFVSVIPMSDGGVIAIGGLGGDLLLTVRVTATGDVVWKKIFEAPGVLSVESTCPLRLSHFIRSTATPDNGFIVAFPTRNLDVPNGVDVMKITNLGNVVWRKSLRADGFVFQSVGTTAGNGVILIGSSTDSNKLKVVVLRANGTLSWKAGYSSQVPGIFQSVSSPIQTPDGGYVVTGTTRSGRKFSGFAAKIDSSRKIAFQNIFGGGRASDESVFATADGGFLLFRTRLSDLFVLKVNSEGVVPGCGFFRPLGSTTRTTFGPLRIAGGNTTASDDLSFESFDFGLSSVVTNRPVSTVCQ